MCILASNLHTISFIIHDHDHDHHFYENDITNFFLAFFFVPPLFLWAHLLSRLFITATVHWYFGY